MATIRWLARGDYNDVLGIEQDQFPHPWTKRDFIRALSDRRTVAKVFEEDGLVLGYMLYKIAKSRLEIVNFAVSYAHMRRGIGRAMINRLKDELARDGKTRLTVRVYERNLAAQLFFKALGFLWVRTARGVYEDSPEDAYEMVFELGQEVPEKATECSMTS